MAEEKRLPDSETEKGCAFFRRSLQFYCRILTHPARTAPTEIFWARFFPNPVIASTSEILALLL
ncbi:hypothetical protein A7X67_13000 [Clostridium sp. W14A]|nr:hypothetical protein A7X67_13000 [Clostridium sp. W14A]